MRLHGVNRSYVSQPINLGELMIELRPLLFATPLLICVNSVMAQDTTYDIDIPAQSLSSALDSLARQTDIKPFFNDSLVSGKSSPAVQGRYTSYEALQKLLIGSDLTYKFTSKNAVTINATESGNDEALTLPAVKVVGKGVYDSTDPYNEDYRLPNSSTATKTDTPIMETPFSVKAVTKQVMEDQQITRVDKAVENVSGVIRSGANGLQRDTFTIRGFDTGGAGNTYRNGVIYSQTLSQVSAQKEVANLESIEVLKGPASLLFGRAEPGGVLNYVTKQPLATPYYSLQQQFGSYNFYRTTADATGSINDDKSLLYRLNLAYENAESFRNNAGNEQVFVAPVLKWIISPKTRATFELEYQNWDTSLAATFPLVAGKFYPFSASQNFAGQNLSYRKGDRILGGFNWSHDFNDNWTVSHSFQVNSINTDSAVTLVRPASLNGNTRRQNGYPINQGDTYTTTVNLTGKFNTGLFKHTSLFGFDYFRLDDKVDTYTKLESANSFNVFSPNFNSNNLFNQLPIASTFRRDAGLAWYGLYYQDQVELPFNLYALGGVRYDESEDFDNINLTNSRKNKVSPRGGLVWRPTQELSVYGSYTENFGASNGFDGFGKALAPQTAQQWEVGAKTELWDGRFSATLAYFDLTKQNIAISTDFMTYTTIGGAESRGIELDISGEVLPGWKMIGGYSFMPFAKVTNDIVASNIGSRLPLAPTDSGSLWNTYEFKTGDLQGLKFGAGVVAAGQRQGNPGNTYQLPGYATINLLTSYSKKIGKTKVTTQFNLDNLLDKTYYTSNTGNEISPLATRTFMGSVRIEY
jgi:iron complex outermembrane receptor protein